MVAEGENVPYPESGNFLQSVRESSHALRVASGVKIERTNIDRLLLSSSFLTSFHRVSNSHGLAFPLDFPNTLSELTLLSTLSLLNFGSGYRIPLHEQTQRGAWDNIRALVFSLYITSSSGHDWLSASGMKEIGEDIVAEQMRVSVHTERPHESIPGVTVGELGGPIHQLVKLVTKTLNETGEALVKSHYPDLGSFVLEALKEGEKLGKKQVDVDTVLERIVRGIPGFRDLEIVDGQPVYIFKKALFLLHAINIRFGSSSTRSSSIPVPDTSSLPIFSDNVVPSMLVYLGVLDLSASSHNLSNTFPDRSSDLTLLLGSSDHAKESVSKLLVEPPVNGPTLTREQSYIIRAAAIDACEQIVQVARELDFEQISEKLPEGQTAESLAWIKSITLPNLDMWLWAVAKDRADYRQLERFEYRDTAMF